MIPSASDTASAHRVMQGIVTAARNAVNRAGALPLVAPAFLKGSFERQGFAVA